MRILAFCLEHAALGFALGFGVLAVGLILPLLHFANGFGLGLLARNPVVGIAGQRYSCAQDGQENPRSNSLHIHMFSYGHDCNSRVLLRPHSENAQRRKS